MSTQKVTGKSPARTAVKTEADSVRKEAERLLAEKAASDAAYVEDIANAAIHTRVIVQEKVDTDQDLRDRLGQVSFMLGQTPTPVGVVPPPAPTAPVPADDEPDEPAAPAVPPPVTPAPEPAPVTPAPADATTQVLVQPPTALPPVNQVTVPVVIHWYDLHRFGWLLIVAGFIAGLIIAAFTWDLFMSMVVNDFIGTTLNAHGTAIGLTFLWWVGWPLFGAGLVGWQLYRHTYPGRHDQVAYQAYLGAVRQWRNTHINNQQVVVVVQQQPVPPIPAVPVQQAQPAQPVAPAAPTA